MRFKVALAMIVLLVGVGALSGCPFSLRAGTARTFHGMKFQWCPAGTFTMGSPADEEGRSDDETQHQVTLTHGFWLGTYEVTQSQWEDVMSNNPGHFDGANRPIEEVSWDDVQEFLDELNSGIGGGKFRLPTEAEWEYAYRARTTTRFNWGEDANESEIDDNAWYEENSASETHPVGGKLANNWGLHDMGGNVYEWCLDFYDEYFDGPVTDPQGPAEGFERVARGGEFSAGANNCRAAFRTGLPPDFHDYAYGFRVLREQ
jgi:formylglycine-generating enzyme required for sulfatase activity